MKTYKTAKDIATKQVYYVDGLFTAQQAIETMQAYNSEALIVKKRSEGDAFGLLLASDIVKGVLIPDFSPQEISVYQLMTKPALTIPAELNARYVPRLLVNAGVEVAPVEEAGELVGIIYLRDFIFNAENR